MPSTHVLTANGRISIPLDEQVAATQISRVLHHLDGTEHFAVALWRTPASARIDFRPVVEYLQAAGSAAGMTIEMSSLIDGTRSHQVIGRSAAEEGTEQRDEVRISWDGHTTWVSTEESFDADAATEIFVHYVEHAGVPPWCSTRPLIQPEAT